MQLTSPTNGHLESQLVELPTLSSSFVSPWTYSCYPQFPYLFSLVFSCLSLCLIAHADCFALQVLPSMAFLEALCKGLQCRTHLMHVHKHAVWNIDGSSLLPSSRDPQELVSVLRWLCF